MNHPSRLRRDRNEWARMAALCLLAVLLMAPSEGPHVASVAGSVELATGVPPVFRAARPGDPVSPGDVIRTGADGRAELVLGRATVRLYPNSLLRVPDSETSAAGPGAVELDRGRSLFDVIKRPDDPFEVRTPEVVVSVKGTRFSVSVGDAAAAVAVFRGLVGVSGLGGGDTFETMVREGFVAAGRDSFELSLHGVDDPWEGWSAGRLDQLPTVRELRLPDSVRGSVLEARAAAIRTARPAAVVAAAERHPEVAAKLEEARRMDQGSDPGEGADPELEAKRERRRQARAERRRLRRDGVLDRKQSRLEKQLEESFVEQVLVDAVPASIDAGAAAMPNPTEIDVSFLGADDDDGGARVWVYLSDSLNWEFDRPFLKKVKKNEAQLPLELSELLSSNGVSQKEFAKSALKLFK